MASGVAIFAILFAPVCLNGAAQSVGTLLDAVLAPSSQPTVPPEAQRAVEQTPRVGAAAQTPIVLAGPTFTPILLPRGMVRPGAVASAADGRAGTARSRAPPEQ